MTDDLVPRQDDLVPRRDEQKPEGGPRRWFYETIFESRTWTGVAFDVALIVAIVASVVTVMAESVPRIRAEHGPMLYALDWGFTVLFTVEYLLRLWCVRRPVVYARSFFGLIDLMAILPGYLDLLVPGTHMMMVVRVLRVLRVFRVLKLTAYLRESRVLGDALIASRRKIGVFLLAVLTLVVIIGALMYLIEGEASGFTDIPTSVYWAVVTLTTVGYGDIAPRTPIGQAVASLVMILGYGIIAVPTGIVTVELSRGPRRTGPADECPVCFRPGHDADARFCKHCGGRLSSAEVTAPPVPPTS